MGEHIFDRIAKDKEIKRSILVIFLLLFVISLFEAGYMNFATGVPSGAFSQMIGRERPNELRTPYCGDGVCMSNEDEFTCIADCGNKAPICNEQPNQCP